MASPIKVDGSKFSLPSLPKNKFISLGQQRGNKGITHSVFLNKSPIHPLFFVSDPFELTGYCSYRLLYNNNESLLCGVTFESFASRTVVTDITLTVAAQLLQDVTEDFGDFEPSFNLESSGILLFRSKDSTIIAIPSDVDSSMLVRVE